MPKIEGTFKPPSSRVTGIKQKDPNPSQPKTLPKKPSDLYTQDCK
jgi:hypothetical protein